VLIGRSTGSFVKLGWQARRGAPQVAAAGPVLRLLAGAIRRAGRWHCLAPGVAVAFLGAAATAQALPEDPARGSWWLSLRTGAGHLEPEDAPGLDAETGWLLAFSGGLVAGDHWLLGVEVGGIGFEAGNVWDPSEGRAISEAFLVAQYHPTLAGGWFLQAAGGWSSYTDNDPQGGIREGDGWGARLGSGYEWRLGQHDHLSVLVTYEHGSIAAEGGDWSYDSIGASLGWSWRW
jgi:hypothetical protein